MPKSSKNKPAGEPKKSSNKKPAVKRKSRSITRSLVPEDWRRDLEVLSRIIGRIRTINDHKKIQISSRNHGLTEFKIATISTKLKGQDLVPVQKNSEYHVVRMSDQKREVLRESFLTDLQDAAEAGAKIVCFHELAYPTPLKKEDSPFKRSIKRLVKKHQIIVIAGSYHDVRQSKNICRVLSDGPVLHHAKLNSAFKTTEYIRIPSNRQLRYYETAFGIFSILICIDVYDPALVLRLMNTNHPLSNQEKVEIVFVPSFSEGNAPATAHACQDLSYATSSLVFFVNCDANEPRHKVFLAGKDLSDNDITSSSYACKRLENNDNVVLHRVSYRAYDEMHNSVGHSYSPFFNYLNGHKDGIRFEVRTR